MDKTTETPKTGKAHGNPHLKHIDSAPSELGRLLKAMPPDMKL
ncbi:hypothetical protein [Candidatus Nitrotoga arctica]|nr:hypothetical protein [Candidatus Nitrotoga arctica]